MSFFNEYPYRNLTDLNLDFILKQIRYLTQQIADFVNLNSIKYADPIQWNITRQYAKNTVVIDATTGTAYLSVKEVPNGITLTNTDHWTPIFTLDILASNHNITSHDAAGSPTATFPSVKGDWILWNSVLYKAIRPIVLHEAYLVGYNLTEFTVDDFVHEYVNALANDISILANKVGSLSDLNTSDKSDLVKAINEVLTTLGTVAGNLTDLDTSDKSNLVNAINEVLSTLGTVAGDLTDLDTSDKSNLVNAINEVLSTVETIAGDLTDLDTSDKSNLVNAINEVVSKIGNLSNLNTTNKANLVSAINEVLSTNAMWIDVSNHGVINDGVTDCTAALQELINATTSGVLYFPQGTYLISSITLPARKISLLGDPNFNTVFKCASDNVSLIIDHDTFSANTRSIEYITIDGNGKTGVKCFDFYRVRYRYISNIHFINCYDGFYVDCSRNMTIKNIYQVGDLHNEFTSSRRANFEYNWNTIVDGWLVDTNANPAPHGAWFTLNAMICTQWSNMVTEGRLECIAFDIQGMNEGTFFNNIVVVCPTFGIRTATADGVQPSCVDINNFSIDQPLQGGLIVDCWWFMVNNFSCVNGNQRNNTESAIIINAASKDVYFNNVISYNMNYATFNIGAAQRVFLSNCSAKDGTIAGGTYTCPTQTATNPKVINCDFETVTANGLTFKAAFNQFS